MGGTHAVCLHLHTQRPTGLTALTTGWSCVKLRCGPGAAVAWGVAMNSKQKEQWIAWLFLLGLIVLVIGGVWFLVGLGDDKARCGSSEMRPEDTCITYRRGHQIGEPQSYSERLSEPGSHERTRKNAQVVLSFGAILIIGGVFMCFVPSSGTPPPPTAGNRQL
jgi:hypothetical protein